MRYPFLYLIVMICLLTACNNDKTKQEPSATDATNTSAANTDDEWQKKAEALQKLSPHTLDQMKAMLPAEINSIARTDASAHSAMGAPYAKGDYRANDSTEITLSIFDCAGDAGVGIYNTQFLMQMKMDGKSADEEEYTRTIDFNGSKAIEHADTDDNSAIFVWLSGDRLLMTLEGKNVSMDVLKRVAGGIK